MNIITYNARGLGRGVKWPAIRRLVNKQHVDMLCIQETKKELIDRDICHALWGDPDVQWADQPATHTAGGILCLWSEKVFRMGRKMMGMKEDGAKVRQTSESCYELLHLKKHGDQ